MESETSFKEMKTTFFPEIYKLYSRVPIVLLGIKFDTEKQKVSTQNLVDLASEIGALEYFEISLKEVDKVKNVIEKTSEYGLRFVKEIENESILEEEQNEPNVYETLKRMEDKMDNLTNEVSEIKKLLKLLLEQKK